MMIEPTDVGERYRISLNHCFHIRDRIQDLHPFLKTMQPIALVEDSTFFLFEPLEAERIYALIATEPAPMPIPQGVRAAFPLDALNGRAACVITGEAFLTLQGYVEIFHEAVHCRQWLCGEQQLREILSLARKAKAENDPMWEIAYPFPYADETIAECYRRWMTAIEMGDEEIATSARTELAANLNALDWDYLAWQEWKEGFARFIENRIRHRLELPANRNGREGAFNRVTFYAGGAAYIEKLIAGMPSLATDLIALFDAIHNLPSSRKATP